MQKAMLAYPCQTAPANCALFFPPTSNLFASCQVYLSSIAQSFTVVNHLFKNHRITGQVLFNRKKARALKRGISARFFFQTSELSYEPPCKTMCVGRNFSQKSMSVQSYRHSFLKLLQFVLQSSNLVSLERCNDEHS